MCLPAYLYAAELNRDGDRNLYAEEHYPILWPRDAATSSPPHSTVAHLGSYISDAYEYPPPFLLLPRLVLALTNDFLSIRALWFMLQGLGLASALLALASWIGGREGLGCGLLAVAVWSSLPVMFSLQWGQVHGLVVSAAVGAMLAFERRRPVLGGALLAAAAVTKLFPGILVIRLLARRQYRGAAWTIAWCAAFVVLGMVVLGLAPYRAFIEYQVPRLQSGQAFAFALNDPLAIAANESIHAIPSKLRSLGVHVPASYASIGPVLTAIYVAAVVAIAAFAGEEPTRRARAAGWLALLVLTSLLSPFAPNLYATVPMLWLLTLLAPGVVRSAWRVGALVVAWILIGMLPPLPSVKATTAAWLAGQLAILTICAWTAARVSARWTEYVRRWR
jgi:hypothetical protein